MRVLKKTRLIPPAADVGSEAYKQLRTFLEIAEGSPEQNRVSELLSELRELWEIMAGLRFHRYGNADIYFAHIDRHPRGHQLRQSLIRKLARYEIALSIGIPYKRRDGIARMDAGWPVLERIPFQKYDKGLAISEKYAVQLLLRLADQGALDSIKKCICGVWFIAERRNHQSCSDKCRHKRYEQGESAKEKRRKYMRNYYRLKISGKVK
jgi:hypothetical protein